MIAYDKRFYYDKAKEPFYDPEWQEAENADEPKQYCWVYMLNGGKCIRVYNHSLAILVSKRTGERIEPLGEWEK